MIQAIIGILCGVGLFFVLVDVNRIPYYKTSKAVESLSKKQRNKKSGLDVYFVDHTAGVYPAAASGFPWSASAIGVKGDPIADLNEDLAAEQKARVTYDNILRLSDDPDVNDVIKYLREREIVHYQRFGEALRLTLERLDEKNVYAMNPSFP